MRISSMSTLSPMSLPAVVAQTCSSLYQETRHLPPFMNWSRVWNILSVSLQSLKTRRVFQSVPEQQHVSLIFSLFTHLSVLQYAFIFVRVFLLLYFLFPAHLLFWTRRASITFIFYSFSKPMSALKVKFVSSSALCSGLVIMNIVGSL